jgi:hypothetical protein
LKGPEYEIVPREFSTGVERHADLLNAIMTTAWERDTCIRVPHLPWSVQGLRAILSRRGYIVHVEQEWREWREGEVPRKYLRVWAEIITPTRPPKPKSVHLVKRRIRL